MTQDMQKLHDAVLLLGDAALEIATALSVFMGSDAAPPWPNTGKPLTAERFHKLMADEPAPRRVSLTAVARKSIEAGTEVVVFGLVKGVRERHLRDGKFITLEWPEGEGGALKLSLIHISEPTRPY